MMKGANNMKNGWKSSLITGGAAAAAVMLMCVFAVQSAQNKAVSLQEAVYTADSDIKV